MASGSFNSGIHAVVTQALSWTALDYKVMLMQSTYTYDPDSDFRADIVANVCTAVGYADSANLGGKTVTVDDANNRVYLDATGPAAFGPIASGQTISGAVVYYATGVDATARLLAWLEFTTPIATNGGTITIAFNAAGILRYQI